MEERKEGLPGLWMSSLQPQQEGQEVDVLGMV